MDCQQLKAEIVFAQVVTNEWENNVANVMGVMQMQS